MINSANTKNEQPPVAEQAQTTFAESLLTKLFTVEGLAVVFTCILLFNATAAALTFFKAPAALGLVAFPLAIGVSIGIVAFKRS